MQEIGRLRVSTQPGKEDGLIRSSGLRDFLPVSRHYVTVVTFYFSFFLFVPSPLLKLGLSTAMPMLVLNA